MDKRTLEKTYQKFQKELYLYLFSLCQNRQLTEDLLQETFLKALLSLSDSHGNVRAWLYAVARNLFYNYQKKAKQEVLSQEDIPDLLHTSDVLDHILQEEKTRKLYDGIRKLDRRKQEVLQLQYFAHLSQKEIAAILHLTPEHVRILAYRARKELKTLLDKEYQEDMK